jgi:hypothetical protein
VLETYRECLQDVFDLPGLRGILGASPPASSTSSSRDDLGVADGSIMLFDYIATYVA